MRWTRRRSKPVEVNYLDLVPVRAVECEHGDDPTRIQLCLPRFRDPLFGRLLQPRLRGERRFIRVPLDARGSWLWPRIDGQCTVGELARLLRQAFPDDTQDLEERLCRYVAALAAHGFLRVEARQHTPGGPPENPQSQAAAGWYPRRDSNPRPPD